VRIAIFVHYYPPHVGGIEVVAEGQATSLAEAGEEVTVITGASGAKPGVMLLGKCSVRRVRAWNYLEKRWDAVFPIYSPSLIWHGYRAVKRADIVHAHDSFYLTSLIAAIWARVLGKPLILTQHVDLVPHPNSVVRFAQRLIYWTTGRFILKSSRQIIVLNSRVAAFLAAKGVDERRITFLQNGVDPGLFCPPRTAEKLALRHQYGLPLDKTLALFVGRFVPKKGFEKLFRLRAIEDVDLIFVGGPAPATSARPDHHFLGVVSRDCMPDLYKLCDVFVLPSEGEGFPLTAQEAMSCGLPVIMTDDPAYEPYNLDRELVQLVEPTIHAITTALQVAASDADRRQAMASYSRAYATKNFGLDDNLAALVGIYAGHAQSDPMVSGSAEIAVDDAEAGPLGRTANRPVVALVIDAIYPYSLGGRELRCHELVRRLADQADIHVYTMNWWNGPRTLRAENVTFHAISKLIPMYRKNRRSIWQALRFAIGCTRLLWCKFDVLEADHIPYFQVLVLRLIATAKRKRFVVTWHEVWGYSYWRSYLGWLGPFASFVEWLAMRLPDHIVAASAQTAERLQAAVGSRTPVSIAPNGIDLEAIGSACADVARTDLVVVGRLMAHKRVGLLLEAIALLHEQGLRVTCRVIGDGPDRSHLHHQAEQLGISTAVEFRHDLREQKEVYSLVKSARAFVAPSDREGFGIAVLEALACGVPVVTTSAPNNLAQHLVARSSRGTICEPSAPALAAAIRAALSISESPTTAANGQDPWLSEYGWESVTPAVVEALRI
jgi:glycosyltransferase involved in cell wall biosynthesis